MNEIIEEYKMREATAAERQGIEDYIASISVDTGFNLWELQEQVKVYDAYKNKGYEQGKKETFNKMSCNCKYSCFAYDEDSHCSGYNYCRLKGFDCVCCLQNCDLLKE